MKTENLTGLNKVLLVLDRKTGAHREDCEQITTVLQLYFNICLN